MAAYSQLRDDSESESESQSRALGIFCKVRTELELALPTQSQELQLVKEESEKEELVRSIFMQWNSSTGGKLTTGESGCKRVPLPRWCQLVLFGFSEKSGS